MNAAQLKEAGFSDDEIRSWLSSKHAELKAAGFNDAEIEAKYGPTPASPPEPPAFDLEKHFRDPDQAPPEFAGLDAGDVLIGSPGGASRNQDDLVLSEVLHDNFVKPWLAVGYTGEAALNRAIAHFANNLDSIAEYIEAKTGLERGGVFAEAAKVYDANREFWQKRADAVGVTFLQELVGEAVGGAVPGIVEFMLNIPYAAALGAAKGHKQGGGLENEIGQAITEAAKRGILGKVFHAIAPLKRYLQAPVMAGTFGAQAAFEGGDAREIAKGVGTGLIYSAASPGGRYGLNEIRDLNRKNLSEAARYNQAINKWIAADLNRRLGDESIYRPEEIQAFKDALRAFDEIRQGGLEELTGGEGPGVSKKTPPGAEERAGEGKIEGEAGGEKPPELIEPKAPPEVGVDPRIEASAPEALGAVLDPGKFPVHRIKVAEIGTNVEKMQFKLDVDAQGVQKELQGEWNELAAGNLLLWQNRKGELIVANGHHRLALARKLRVEEVHAQILREADGFTMEDARRLAAEANILEGKGTIYDHAEYFRLNAEYTAELAKARGLAGQGFAIGRLATDRTYDLFRNRKIGAEAAEAISRGAPGDEILQAAGARFAVEKPKADAYEITSMMQALSLESRPSSEQADLFGFDDSAIRQAEAQAKIVAGEIRGLRDQINAVRGAAKRPEVAKKLGVDVKDPEAIRAKVQELQAEVEAWQSWYTNPRLVTKVREKSGYVPETVDSGKVRQPAKTLDDLYLLAEKAYPELMEASHHLADKYGGSVHERPVTDKHGRQIAYVPVEGVKLKSKESAARKLASEKGGTVEQMTDIAGTSVVFEDYATMLRALGELTRLYRGKLWFRNTFEKRLDSGYGDINCRIQTENGAWMELQIHKRSLFEAKEDLGHPAYEITRELYEAFKKGNKELGATIDEINEATRKYYSEAESKDSASSLETSGILSHTLREVCESSIGTNFLKDSTRNAVMEVLSQAKTPPVELVLNERLSGSLPGIGGSPSIENMPEVNIVVKDKLTVGEALGEIKTEKIPGETVEQAVIPGAGAAETFGLTGSPGEIGTLRTPAPGQGTLLMSPEAGFRRTPEKGGEAEKPMSRSEIRQFLEEKLNIPIRTGRFIGKALGIFKPRSEVVRTKYANDIEVIAHEVGHALHKFLWPETLTKKGLSAQPFQAFAHELDKIATVPRKGQSNTAEGWAEFVRLYVTDVAQAQRRAPDFFNFFEAQLELKAPEVREILLEARAKYQKFMQQPPLQRILSQISIGKSDKAPRNFDELYTMALDDLHPLELAVKEMAQGQRLPASKDPYKLARLLRGWHGKAEAFLKHTPFSFGDYKDIPGAKSLKQILEPVRDNLDEFRAYVVAKRALELAERKVETGIYRSDAEAIVNLYEGRFRETHRELLEFQDLTLKYLLDAGLLTPEAFAKMKIMNRDYVPFYRVMENTKGQGTGVGLEGRNPVKKIRGSWRDIVDPLESIIKNTFTYINLAEKNAVGRALVDLERSGEGLGKFVEKIPTPMKKTTVTPEEMARYMENLAESLGFEAKELPADMFDALEIFRPSAFVPKDNVIQVWEKGKRGLYQVDPEIGRVFKALDRENVNFLVKMLSLPAQWLRAGATLTPEFIGRNPIRDQWSAFCYSRYGFVPGFDLVRGIFSMVKKDQAYWDFKKAGADHSMLVSLDRDYLQDNLGDLLQKYPIRNVIKNPINGLRMLSELGEMGTRLGEFKRGLAKEAQRRPLEESTAGEPSKGELAEAAFSAREVTLDFARMGAKTKAANALIAFWNAQLQGTDRFVRAFQENPLGTSVRVAASITLPSVLLAIANHDDPRYKELPQWQKDLFWIVITDKTVWRIPKPFELGILFGSVPERVTNYILDQDPHAFDKLGDTLLRAASPGMIPTVQAPFIENWANRSLFFDRNLVPMSREDLLPEYQYSDHTSETAKLLSSVVGRFPGLDQWKAAAPAYIENLVYGWSGGLGRYALQIADAGLKAAGAVEEKFQKPAATLADIPFVKAFVVRYPSAQAESIQRFYDNFDKALAVNKTIKVLMEKEQNPEAAAKLWQSSGMADLQGIRTALSNAHNTIDLVYRNPDMTPDEKRELIDQIYMQMIAMAQNGNKLAESFEKARKEEVERQKNRGIVKERAPASVAVQPRTPPPPGPESRPVQF